jgi:8-oxo-dGTP pyrophosphatase MutT (NUDIX family)
MAADEPTTASASQEEKAGSGGGRKRRRRRRPRRKPGTSTGGTASQGQAKKTGGQSGGGKAASASRRGSSSGGGAKRKGQQRSRKKQRGGTPRTAGAKGTGAKQGGAKGGAKPPPRRQKIPTTREVSAGGVVYRKTDDGIEVVLASRRTRRGQLAWGLAKGGIEEGETKEVAAIREVREETGMTAVIEADLGDTKYMYVWDDIRIRKTVHFFLMRHTGGNVEDRDDEMEEIRWFPMERAIKRAAYRGERDMLVKASELLQ